MAALYKLVWLVYFKPVSELSFLKTPFQSEKTFCEICEQHHQYLNSTTVSESLREEQSTMLTELSEVKLANLGEASEDADEVVLPV